KGVNLRDDVERVVHEHLGRSGVTEELADILAAHGASASQFRTYFLAPQTDSFWRKGGGEFVFGDLVKLFTAAQFNRGLLLVDEVEKIVYHQNVQERRSEQFHEVSKHKFTT